MVHYLRYALFYNHTLHRVVVMEEAKAGVDNFGVTYCTFRNQYVRDGFFKAIGWDFNPLHKVRF